LKGKNTTETVKKNLLMEHKYSKIVNREKRTAEIMLYGIIGEKIDGDYFAQELNWLGREFDEINIRINSMGGDVEQGLSIVSEMRASRAYIVTTVEGVAASMAAVIALAGDERRMNDYGRMMLHLAYFVDNEGNKIEGEQLSKKDQKALEQMNGILSDILKRTGKDENAIKKIMTDETWYTAETAKAEGFVGQVIDTTSKELAAMAPAKLVAKVMEGVEFNKLNNVKPMKKLAAKFGLSQDATEEQILAKIQENETKAANDAVEKFVVIGKALGTITKENEEKATRLAKADFELAAEMFLQKPEDESQKADDGKDGKKAEAKGDEKKITIAELVKELRGEGGSQKPKAWEDYTAEELETMREKDRKTYVAVYKGRYGVEPELED
jgi:ATP-dependent protease ClpP protease subunit